jgi:hypothetical protein
MTLTISTSGHHSRRCRALAAPSRRGHAWWLSATVLCRPVGERRRSGGPYFFRVRKLAPEPLAGAGVLMSVNNTLPPTRWLGIVGMIAVAVMVGVGIASFSSAVATDSIIGVLAMAALWAGSSLLFERADLRLSPPSDYILEETLRKPRLPTCGSSRLCYSWYQLSWTPGTIPLSGISPRQGHQQQTVPPPLHQERRAPRRSEQAYTPRGDGVAAGSDACDRTG